MEKGIKITIAALLFMCLLDMPYGFFQFIRFASLVGFSILAFKANEQSQKTEAIIFIVLAILFQPLIKISFGREIWNIIDVIVGIGLLVSIFLNTNKNK